VVGEHLYAGLRTPVASSSTFLVRARVDALFAPGVGPLTKDLVETRPLRLGENAGVRDLAALSDGGLLILSGPAVDQPDVDYKIWHLPTPIWDRNTNPTCLMVVKTKAKAKDKNEIPKAESLTVIEQDDKSAVVVVNYDNVDEGAPTKHVLNLGQSG